MGRSVGIWGAKLNAEYEFENGRIHTEAYIDPLGYWTGPGGIRFLEFADGKGRPVQEGDSWTEDEALALYAKTLQAYADEVSALLPPGLVLNQFQFDALVVFCWNNGAEALRTSSMMKALRAVPARFEEAAAAFLLYRRGTLWGGTTGPDGTPARGPDDKPLPKGVSWFKAMSGILRRSAATACLFMGLNWAEACRAGTVNLSKRPDWRPAENRWYDTVVDATPWKTIHDRARTSPLTLPKVVVKEEPLPEVAPAPVPVPAPKPAAKATKAVPVPNSKPPSINTKDLPDVPYKIDPNAGAKPMEETERFVGQLLITLGIVLKAFSGNIVKLGGLAGTGLSLGLSLINNPVSFALLCTGIAMAVAGVFWLIGKITEMRGKKIRERGRVTATQVMI